MADTWEPPPTGGQCWVEIPTTGDVEELKTFYSRLFPSWTFRAGRDDTEHKDAKEVAHFESPQGLSGGIVKMPPGVQAQKAPMGIGMTVYYIVPNLEEIEQNVHQLGGTTCMGKTAEGKNSFFMNFYDPVGNRFGAFQFGG